MADIENPSVPKPPKMKFRVERNRALSSTDSRIFQAEERKVFAMNIKYARHCLGLTVHDVGRLIDANGTYVALVERAQNNTSIDRMATFAQALGHPLHALLNPRFVSDSKLDSNNQKHSPFREEIETAAKGRPLKPDK
jgi:transcriptional regulator with XRE-family HTH domain